MMETLVKNVTLVHQPSEYHLKKVDILIENGIIAKIGHNLSSKKSTIVSGNNLHCTIGLCDIGTHSGEPGFEHRETIDSLTKAALKGGFTSLVIFPGTKPITQNKSQIRYLINHTDRNNVQILPVGALSKDINGQDLAEIFDMREAGAVAFGDGLVSVQDSGLLSRALQYASTTDKLIIHHPDDHTLSSGGEMHEGETSTLLGMKGQPSISEIHAVQRDILLLEYNNGRLLIHAISAKESIHEIKSAKKKSLKVFCSVPYTNLIFTDTTLMDFDQNLKVTPPLRSEKDRKALINGLKDDTIDCIISNHIPLDEEVKNLEFPYSESGASGIETCFVACLSYLKDELSIEKIVEKLTVNPRKILHLTVPKIIEGERADLCVFDTDISWTYEKSDICSKSNNNPFLGKKFTSKVIYTVC